MNRTSIVGIAFALILSLGLLGTALAHAELVSSDPAAGAKLTAPPAKITLVFSEEIDNQGSSFTLADEQGATVGAGKLDLDDLDHKTLTGTPDAALGDGVYTVAWEVITSDDKAKEEGTFSFSVSKASAAQPTAVPATTRPTTAAPAAAVPTASAAGGASPTDLPRTAGDDVSLLGFVLLAATLVLAGGAVLYRSKTRMR